MLVDYAYDKMIERMNAIENAPRNNIYQTIGSVKGDLMSYVLGYVNYYNGVFEGILFTKFVDEFDRMPTPSENSFIKDTISTRFNELKNICMNLADKKFKEDV